MLGINTVSTLTGMRIAPPLTFPDDLADPPEFDEGHPDIYMNELLVGMRVIHKARKKTRYCRSCVPYRALSEVCIQISDVVSGDDVHRLKSLDPNCGVSYS
jgi:hypothetical protein